MRNTLGKPPATLYSPCSSAIISYRAGGRKARRGRERRLKAAFRFVRPAGRTDLEVKVLYGP